MKTIAAASLFLLLAGCGFFDRPPPEQVSKAGTIGAVSLLGEQVNLAQDKDEPVVLGLDRFAVEQLNTSLAAKTKLRFAAVNYKYAEFEPMYRSTARTPYADYDLGEVREALERIKKTPGVELLIVVAKARRDIGGGQFVRGAAVANRSSLLGFRSGPVAVLAANVLLVDMNDFKILSTAQINQQQDLEKGFRTDSLRDASPEQLKFLEVFYKSALATELDRAVKSFGLPAGGKK